MKNMSAILSTLKRELEFLDQGGYEVPVEPDSPCSAWKQRAWRRPLIFEESPSCPKKKYCACDPDVNCALMSLVPIEHLQETVPCRYIPLNQDGETLESLYRTGTNEEINSVLRQWLVKTIAELEARLKTNNAVCERCA